MQAGPLDAVLGVEDIGKALLELLKYVALAASGRTILQTIGVICYFPFTSEQSKLYTEFFTPPSSAAIHSM